MFFIYSNLIVDFIVGVAFLYLIFHCAKNISFDDYCRLVISVLSISFCYAVIIAKYTSLTAIKAFVLCLISIHSLSIAVIKMLKDINKNRIIQGILKSSSVTVCFFPLMTSVYFEFLNVMNSHNIFVSKIIRYYIIASALLVCCTSALFLIIYRKKLELKFWKRIAYPALIVGLAALSTQPALSMVYSAHIFESANLSIPVSNFLNFGKIPVVTCYPGHMMTGVWQAFLYAFLNGDNFGAIFSPYWFWLEFSVLALLFFYFVKTVLDEDVALFASIVFPFSALSAWSYFGLGMLLALAVMIYAKKQTLFRAFLIWISFAWITLYRLDLGFAFFAAAIISLAIWIFQKKDKIAIKKLLVSFIISGLFGIMLWTILCIQQNVNPLLRLFEFLKISASNQTWAYSTIGNKNTNLFVAAYLIVPFFMFVSIAMWVFSKTIRRYITDEHWILLLIFGFSYFFNMPRGLVRHSLAENHIAIVFWNMAICLSAMISVFLHKKNLFLPVFAFFLVSNLNFVDSSIFTSSSIADKVLPHIARSIEEGSSQKRERVILEQDMKERCDSYKLVMDSLLSPDETYIDFMNRTFVYSAIGRENPVYVAQSPLMLSGEFTQEMFIKEISGRIETVPFAILPLNDTMASASIDGIFNSYHYYKVSEFIFTHYRPLLKYGDFAVWALNERYDFYKNKIAKNEDIVGELIDSSYSDDFHTYNLAYLPVLWGEKDKKKASENPVITELRQSQKLFVFDSEKLVKTERGNYLSICISNNSDENKTVGLQMGISSLDDFKMRYSYTCTVLPGNHRYLFRISSDYCWYFENINALKVDDDVSILEAKILEGD